MERSDGFIILYTRKPIGANFWERILELTLFVSLMDIRWRAGELWGKDFSKHLSQLSVHDGFNLDGNIFWKDWKEKDRQIISIWKILLFPYRDDSKS